MIKAGFYNTRGNVGCKQILDNLQLLEKLANHLPWSTATEASNELNACDYKDRKEDPDKPCVTLEQHSLLRCEDWQGCAPHMHASQPSTASQTLVKADWARGQEPHYS